MSIIHAPPDRMDRGDTLCGLYGADLTISANASELTCAACLAFNDVHYAPDQDSAAFCGALGYVKKTHVQELATCFRCRTFLRLGKAGLAGEPKPSDAVNHPKHYNSHPSGVECIDIIEHMPHNVGAAVKYLWRAGLKENAPTEQDYKKAVWYIEREIERLKKEGA